MILPAVATLFFMHQYEIGSIPIALAALGPAFISISCGIWLGLAWRGYPFAKAILRSCYIGIITTLLVALGGHPDMGKKEFITLFGMFEKTFGLCFYCGWFLGSSARDVILDIYPSPKHRVIAKRRQARFRRWYRIALELEDEGAALPTNRLVGRAIRNLLTNPAQLIAFITAVLALIAAIYQGIRWLLGVQ